MSRGGTFACARTEVYAVVMFVSPEWVRREPHPSCYWLSVNRAEDREDTQVEVRTERLEDALLETEDDATGVRLEVSVVEKLTGDFDVVHAAAGLAVSN